MDSVTDAIHLFPNLSVPYLCLYINCLQLFRIVMCLVQAYFLCTECMLFLYRL